MLFSVWICYLKLIFLFYFVNSFCRDNHVKFIHNFRWNQNLKRNKKERKITTFWHKSVYFCANLSYKTLAVDLKKKTPKHIYALFLSPQNDFFGDSFGKWRYIATLKKKYRFSGLCKFCFCNDRHFHNPHESS